jgi:hypothetical protein
MMDAFDLLYEEGAEHPKLMAINLHEKLGANEWGLQPGRLRLLGSQILLASGIGGIRHGNSVLNGARELAGR